MTSDNYYEFVLGKHYKKKNESVVIFAVFNEHLIFYPILIYLAEKLNSRSYLFLK